MKIDEIKKKTRKAQNCIGTHVTGLNLAVNKLINL